MKAITRKEGFPKFLKVSGEIKNKSYNKYLLKPYKEGEIVKVADFEEQNSVMKAMDKFSFLRRFVNILRKDDDGKFTLKFCTDWSILEPLKKA